MSRSEFGHLLKKALEAAGLETSRYSGHSLRIGAATSAAAAGVPDHLIKPPDTFLSVASLIGGRQ